MARVRRTFVRGGRQVRESSWVFVTETSSTLAAANTALLIGSANAALLALRPFTIVRTRGVLAIRSDQTAASENFSAALGIAIVSDQASAIGITAVPTPFTDLGSDLFFVHQMMANRFEFVSGVGVEAKSMQFLEYDSKAMRKVNDSQDIAVVLENSSISAGTNIFHAARILIKLH